MIPVNALVILYRVHGVSSELTASRTITLRISDWARLQEIEDYRSMKDFKEVLRYVIRSEHAMIISKKGRDNAHLEKQLSI